MSFLISAPYRYLAQTQRHNGEGIQWNPLFFDSVVFSGVDPADVEMIVMNVFVCLIL